MRLSVDPYDPGYLQYLLQKPVLVYLDGVKVERCVMADDSQGVVEYTVTEGGGVFRECKRGNVQIVPFGHGL